MPRIAAAQGKPVKIGVILYLSGVQAFMGQQTRRGNEFGAKVVKAAGGPAMEFVYGDAESKPENGRVQAERLIRQGCTLLIGTNDSGSTIAVAQAAEQAKIPFLINIASAPQITEQGFTQIFRNFPPATALVANAVARIKELATASGTQPKTAVILHVNDTFGHGVMKGVEILWNKLQVPVKILDRVSYDVRARDLSVEVAKAKAVGADLLMPITRVNDAILIVREMVKQNWSPMGIISPGSPGPYEKAFTDALGKYGDGYMSCVPWYDPTKKRAQEIAARFEKETGGRFDLNAVFAFEAVEIAADAIKRAKSADPAAIHAALKATNIEDHVAYGGPIKFDAKGQNPNIGGVMLQNQGGKPLVVLPAAAAQAKPVFPLVPFDKR
ncbi:MAG: ABC transporter substrate-binding protein [Rhodospirillaceae bacterium]|nr:ABC transporter substrate-binding protein [Rhodospirillaceae bacterium]